MSKAIRCDRCKRILDDDNDNVTEPYNVNFTASRGGEIQRERNLADCCPRCLDIVLRCIDGTRKSKPKPAGESQKKEGKPK